VIFGSFLVSNDHCYILLNVADHFEFRVLYVHTLFSILLRIKVSLQSVKNLLVFPGSSGHPRPVGSGKLRMIRPLPRSSSPRCTTIYRAEPPVRPSTPHFFQRQCPFAPPNCAWWSPNSTKDSWSSLTPLIPHALEDPNLSGTSWFMRENSKVFHSKLLSPDLSI